MFVLLSTNTRYKMILMKLMIHQMTASYSGGVEAFPENVVSGVTDGRISSCS